MKTFIKQNWRHLLALLCILVISVTIFVWVGIDMLPEAAGKTKREIINDDYTCLSQDITDQVGIMQSIKVENGTKLYGVNLNLHTFNRIQQGTVFVDLLDADNKVLASASSDLTTVLDNTFKMFLFDNMQSPNKDTQYTLHIYIEPQTSKDKIALWQSEKTIAQGFEMQQNGKDMPGSAAIQYITNYTGNFIYKAYAFISAFAVIALLLGYFLIFIKKIKPQNIFLYCAVVIGLIFCVFTPQRSAPDEYVHVATSYSYASKLLGKSAFDQNGQLLVRKCDAVDLNTVSEYSVFSWKDTYEGIFEKPVNKDEYIAVKGRTANVFPPLYWAQTIGIALARLLGFGYIPMLLMGRIFNLAQYIALVYFAVKIIPIRKTMLSMVALLPMALQLAGSFSYDTILNGLCFLFIASCLAFTYSDKKLSYLKAALLALMGVFIAPSKTIYIVVVLFCFIIPTDKFKTKKQAILLKTAIVLCAAISWAVFNFSTAQSIVNTISPSTVSANETAQMQSDAVTTKQETPQIKSEADLEAQINSDIAPNGDAKQYFTLGYCLTHISKTVKLVLHTVQQNTELYLQGMLGGRLGEIILVNIEISWIYVFALVLILLLSTIKTNDEPLAYVGFKRWWGLLITVAVIGLVTLACITWTPINYQTIFGIQGRYFLPVLPLALLAVTNNVITLKRPIEKQLCFAMLCINVLIILNAFTIVAS